MTGLCYRSGLAEHGVEPFGRKRAEALVRSTTRITFHPYEESVWNAFEATATVETVAARARKDREREKEQLLDPTLMGSMANAKNNKPVRKAKRKQISRRLIRRLSAERCVSAVGTGYGNLYRRQELLGRADAVERCAAATAEVRNCVDCRQSVPAISLAAERAFKLIAFAMSSDLRGVPNYVDFLWSTQELAAHYASETLNEQFLITLAWGFANSNETPVAKHLLNDLDRRLASKAQTPERMRIRSQALQVLALVSDGPGERDDQIITARDAWRMGRKQDCLVCRLLLRGYRVILACQAKPEDRVESAREMEAMYLSEDADQTDWFTKWLGSVMDLYERRLRS